MVVTAWTIGSITLLIVKGDATTSEYRDALKILHQYADMHDIEYRDEPGGEFIYAARNTKAEGLKFNAVTGEWQNKFKDVLPTIPD